MKTFKQFMNEETMPFAGTDQGFVGIEDPAVRDNLNQLLAGMTSDKFITPYIGLERVAKALANYHIFIPKHSFLEGDSGMLTFPINQFGGKVGMQNNGEVITSASSPYSIFFEYRMGDCGMFRIFCEVVNQEELDELLADVEAELNDDTEEEDNDEMNEAVLAGAETGPRKTPGSHEAAHEPDDDDEEEDDDDEAGLVVAEENIDEVDLSKITMNKNTGQLSTKDPKIDLSKVRMNKTTNQIYATEEVYHPSYTSAIQTAVAAAKKRGYEVDPDDYQNKVASGPRKPSEGKTVSHNIKLMKDGKPTKKGLAIQVYNRGGDKTPYELNHYISEEQQISEISRDLASRYIKKAKSSTKDAYYGDDAPTMGKRKKGIDLALKKKWGDKSYGTDEPKVKATNESSNPAKEGMIAAGYKGSNPAEQGSIAAKKDDEHFTKQSKKMQNAINLHLRRGKNYKEAVAAAKKHVKE